MDITISSKQDLINIIISTLIMPSSDKINDNFTAENDKLYNDFILKARNGKSVSVKLPVDYLFKTELFDLVKSGIAFVESSYKFISTITTKRPADIDIHKYSARFTGNEFHYSFLDNHPGILNVDRLTDIPVDYEGLIAVPVTVLEYKHIANFNVHRVIYAPKHCGKLIYPRVVISNKFVEI